MSRLYEEKEEHSYMTGVLCTELAMRGSGSSFSVECGDQCRVLHGDYRFPT